MENKFWKWAKAESGSELILEGVIAKQSWDDDSISPSLFREELEQHRGALTVRINSPGGDVAAGIAIYNMLNEHEGGVTVKVDGLAASIASLISMAGDKIIMLPGSMMMVHLPWVFAAGNSDDMEQVVEMLKKTGESMVPIYAARTGLSEERINELLKAETWMTAQDAVELGFADEAIGAKSSLAQSLAKISELTSSMQSAVMQPVMSMKAKKPEEQDAINATEEPVKDVAETTEAAAEQEKTDEIIEPETTEVTEPVAKEIKKPQLKEKETAMEDQEKIAATQVLEPKAQAEPNATPKPTVKDYLKTKASMEAFALILEENAATSLKDKTSAERVRAAWKEHLEVKAGVTNPEIFLPEPLVTEIEDAFKRGGEIWQRVSKTGMDSFNAAWDKNDDPDAESGRASGYNRDEEENKREQQLEFDNRILRPQFVYKYITLNKEDVKEQRTTGALVRFVLAELPKRIIREVERAIVIGDGRAPGSDYKIQEGTPRGFFNVKADAAANSGAGNAFARTYVPQAGQTVYETLRRARALVKAEGGVILVAKEGLLLDMEFEQNANGGFLFAPGSDLTRYIKVDAVVEPDWMENDENDAYIFAYGYYRIVGDLSVEAFQNFILKTNKNEYLQEIWAGGGLTALKSGVAVAPQATS